MLKKCFSSSRNFSFKIRGVYLDVSYTNEYRTLQEADKSGDDWVYWGEIDQAGAKEKIFKAVAVLIDKDGLIDKQAKEEKGSVIKDPPPLQLIPGDKISDEDKKKNDQLKAEYDAAKSEYEEYKKKEAAIDTEVKKLKAEINTLKTQIEVKIGVAFTAKENLLKDVEKRITAAVNEELPKQTKIKNRSYAETAADVADDGTLYMGNEVRDYLKGTVDGKLIEDYRLESFVMGITYQKFAENAGLSKDDSNHPARKFIRGLSDREKESGGWSDDKGVDPLDVKDEVIKTTGMDKFDKKDTKVAEGRVTGLYNKIITDTEINGELAGMLIGKLAKNFKTLPDLEKACNEVDAMYNILKTKKTAPEGTTRETIAAGIVKQIGGYENRENWIWYKKVGGAIGDLAGGAVSGYTDEWALKKAGAVMLALNDIVNVQKNTQDITAEVNALAGKGFKGLDRARALIKTYESDPSDENLKAVKDVLAVADMKGKIPQLEKDIKALAKLYSDCGVSDKFPFGTKKINALISENNLEKMAKGKQTLESEIEKARTDLTEMMKKVRDGINQEIETIEAYKKFQEEAKKSKKKGSKKMPRIKSVYERIRAESPGDIKKAIDKHVATIDKFNKDLETAKKWLQKEEEKKTDDDEDEDEKPTSGGDDVANGEGGDSSSGGDDKKDKEEHAATSSSTAVPYRPASFTPTSSSEKTSSDEPELDSEQELKEIPDEYEKEKALEEDKRPDWLKKWEKDTKTKEKLKSLKKGTYYLVTRGDESVILTRPDEKPEQSDATSEETAKKPKEEVLYYGKKEKTSGGMFM